MPENQTPQVAVTKRYYPTLSTIINPEDIPEILGFIKGGLENLLGKIHYKDLQYSKSPRGDAAFYSLSIVSPKRLGIELPGTGINLVLNPDITGGDYSISSFPITIEYQWKILAYLRAFSSGNFSFNSQEIFEIALRVLNISEEQALANFINIFVNPIDETTTPLEQFINDINSETTIDLSNLNDPTDLTEITQQINIQGGQYSSLTAFGVYILDADNDETFVRVKTYFKVFIPSDINEFIKDILIPKFRATLTLIAGVEFPRNILKPVYDENGLNPFNNTLGNPELEVIPPDNPNSTLSPEAPKVLFTFAEALFYADTEQGFGYNMELVLNSTVPAQIGNTGLILFINNLKLDLSQKENIAEADADGRPNDFMGFYTEQTDIYLPKKWFSKDPLVQQTLKISGKKLLVGTGGISGTIALEAVDLTNPIGQNDYLEFNIGGNNGFKIGFNKFDISFKQSVVTESNIRAALEIPKLKFPIDHPVYPGGPFKVDVFGHLDQNGDFNLSASAVGGIVKASLGNYVDFNFLSLELGKQDSDFYIGTSVELTFPEGLIHELIGDQKIIIPRIRFYSNGRFEIVGGNGFLPVNITLPLGPVDITVTGIHMGSIQREHNGVMRNYNYVGFNGSISVEPFNLDARGEGLKYYYTTDDDDFNGVGDSFVHIQTIEIDLVVPTETKTVSLHGMLSIPEPGASQEYIGEVDFKVSPKDGKKGISGKASMKLAPKFPAFIVDAEINLPKPIPFGSVAIYGFRGLVGYRYVAEKKAIKNLPENATWYDYYKYPPKGIHVSKFSGPYDSSKYNNPFSFGAGAVLGTSFDNGTIINIRAMLLLSIPSLFMIEGRASILSTRLGLTDSKEPPFWAMIAWGDNSIEMGMGADFKMPTATGKLLRLNANVESFFPLNNSKSWYVNIGTREKPNVANILPEAINLRAMSYLMLASQGMEFGARVDFELKKNFFGIKVKIWAYVEIGAQISFERPQFGGYVHLGGGIDVNVWRVLYLNFSLDAYLSGEAVRPYLIFAKLEFRGRVRVMRLLKIKFKIKLQLKWEKNQEVILTPIPALANGNGVPNNNTIELVKAVHMLTNETFDIKYLTHIPNISEIENVIPLDSYIDIKFTKGVVPNNITSKIGGHTSGAENFIDLIPPLKTVRGGHVLRQVKHKYSIESIELYAYNGSDWVEYNPTEAVDFENFGGTNPKIGYWQRSGNQYDTIRLLGNNPFSYVDQGEPGWFIPEQYGITASNLFCHNDINIWHTANVLNKNLGASYPVTGQMNGHFINGAYFMAIGEFGVTSAIYNDIPYNHLKVTNAANTFGFAKSLSFNNSNGLRIFLEQDAPIVKLKLNTFSNSVQIKYYKSIIIPNSSQIGYELVELKLKTSQELHQQIVFENSQNPIIKIEIIPIAPENDAINAIYEQIEDLFTETYEDSNGIVNVTFPNNLSQYNNLINQLEALLSIGGESNFCIRNNDYCKRYEGHLEYFNTYFLILNEYEIENYMYSMNEYQTFIEEVTGTTNAFQITSDLLNDLLSEYINLKNEIISLLNEGASPELVYENYLNLKNIAQSILDEMNVLGCCNIEQKTSRTTSLQELKWKTMSDFEFETTIPSQQAIQEESEALINSITNIVQPIWRPKTNYYFHFVLKDLVNETNVTPFNYYYAFKTRGPIGHFHDADNVKYGNEFDKNGVLQNRKDKDQNINLSGKLTNSDKYSLTNLRKYLDYDRSYPNVDGNLLRTKPLFYGNEDCKITLNFTKPLAFHMFKTWEPYKGLPEIKGALNIGIKDPVTGLTIEYPIQENIEVDEIIPQTNPLEGNTESWVNDNDPRIPLSIQLLNNLVSNGSLPCQFTLGEPLAPKSYSYSVSISDLKPQKLYTALINNAFDNNNSSDFIDYENTQRNIIVNENKEVHQFVFQTSRYRNFQDQVNSYIIDIENNKKAVFTIENEFSNSTISNAYQIISKNNIDIDNTILSYTDLFDRVIEGVFKFKPLDVAVTTEFNLIKNSLSGNIVAILIRNPEPFNNPKINSIDLEDSIVVVSGTNEILSEFKILHSKDYSQCLIMNQNIQIVDEIKIRFIYKSWNGVNYVGGNPITVTVKI